MNVVDRGIMSLLTKTSGRTLGIGSLSVRSVVKRVEDHLVRRLFDAGVPITLNTDDPAMFGCTLVSEYELAKTKFGFSKADLEGVARTAFEKAFV